MAPKREIKKPLQFESDPFVIRRTKIPKKRLHLPKDKMDFLENYFKTNGDVPKNLRKDLTAKWFQGTELTKKRMQNKLSQWVRHRRFNQKNGNSKLVDDDNKKRIRFSNPQKRCHFQKKKAQNHKNEESGVKNKESDGKNVIKLDDLTCSEEAELMKLYRRTKTVTFEMMMEWASEVNKNVHTVLDWIVRQREKGLEEDMGKMGADEVDLPDGSPINKERLQEAEDMEQEEEDDMGPRDAEDVFRSNEVEQDDSGEKEEPDIIEIADDDITDLQLATKEKGRGKFIVPEYLKLENKSATECFINTITNLLYRCKGFRDIVKKNASSKHPLCGIIDDIFSRRTRSTNEWRKTLSTGYLLGQQDVAEIFCALMNKLGEEIKLDIMACTVSTLIKCTLCRSKSERPACNEIYSDIAIDRQDTFENFYKEKYGSKPGDDCRCGGKREMRTTLTPHGKYHFMTITHEEASFQSPLDVNQKFQMFDSTWKIISFAEYLPRKSRNKEQSKRAVTAKKVGEPTKMVQKGRNGHYVAWVKVDDEWLRVNDNRVDQKQEHLDLSKLFVNIIAFEKIED